MTVKDDEKDIVKGFELGAVDYIIKPFYSEVLLKRVEVHLKLASAMNEIEQINLNLNEIVNNQIKELRQKDEIIVQQSKISAIASVIDIISVQWKKPLDKIKLYLQSLDFRMANLEEFKDDNIFQKTLKQVNKLDESMLDFHKFFNNQKNKEDVNLKVALDNAIFLQKDRINELNVNINIEGDNLLSLNIVFDEIKHIFVKLMTKSFDNFKLNKSIENKVINFSFDNVNNSIFITCEDNAGNYDENQIEKFFNVDSTLKHEDFDLGFYLVKVFVEKNFGLLMIKKTENGIRYIIRFDK